MPAGRYSEALPPDLTNHLNRKDSRCYAGSKGRDAGCRLLLPQPGGYVVIKPSLAAGKPERCIAPTSTEDPDIQEGDAVHLGAEREMSKHLHIEA